MPIILNRVPFSEGFIPPYIVDRAEEQDVIRKHCEPVARGEVQPANLFVVGNVGTGKTITTKVVLGSLPVKPCYIRVDEWVKSKTYKMMSDILLSFGLKPFGNLESSLNEFKRFVRDKPFLVVIDEADNAEPQELSPLIHFLSRETCATTILISRKPDLTSELREDTKDSFKCRNLVFSSYGETELFGILKQRAALALRPESYTDEILSRIAKEAKPFGSARYALDLLLRSAEIAEERGRESITEADVWSAVNDAERLATMEAISKMPAYHRLLLAAIHRLIKIQGRPSIQQVAEKFRAYCRYYGLRELSQRTLYNLIADLKARGYLDIVKHGKGRGKGFESYIEVPAPVLEILNSLASED